MRAYILPVLAVVSVLLYLSSLIGKTGPEPLFKGIDKDAIVEIEIKKAEQLYTLKKNNGGWNLIKPVQWAADKDKVNRLIEAALKTTLENPVTNKKEDLKKYHLTESGDFLTLKTPSKSITVFVGKRGPRYSLVYVRRKGDSKVYLVDASFADELPTGKNYFRDRTIWRFKSAQVLELRWTMNNERFQMIKTTKGWSTQNGKILPVDRVDAYLTYLSNLQAAGFPENDQLPKGSIHLGQLQIKTTDKTYTLTFYKGKKDNYYIVYNGHVYKAYEYQKDEIFKKIKPQQRAKG